MHEAISRAFIQVGIMGEAVGAGDANRLIDGECFDPVAGSNSLRNFPCQVSPLPV